MPQTPILTAIRGKLLLLQSPLTCNPNAASYDKYVEVDVLSGAKLAGHVIRKGGRTWE